ncbi:MAG: leucine-rich repeat protein [Ruminococcus sp.]|nr:leucine-rich repeat protein [Ruminococcus sp.]
MKIKKLLAALSCAALLFCTSLPAYAQDELTEAPAEVVYAQDGQSEGTALPAEQVSADTNASEMTATQLLAATSSTYGYKDLAKRSNGSGRQKFYNRLFNYAAENFATSPTNVAQFTTGGKTYNYFAKIRYSDFLSSSTEAIETYTVLKYDCPILYQLMSAPLYDSDYLWLTVPDEFIQASVREGYRKKILKYLDDFKTRSAGLTTRYDKVLCANNFLVDKLEYAYDKSGDPDPSSWAHSIIGAMEYGKGVCECYSKTVQMLLNYIGEETIYCIGFGNGGTHAWDMMKMDDGKYYYLDVTWNDTTSGNIYFAAGTTSFNARSSSGYLKHEPFLSSYTGAYFLYDLPSVPAADYIPSKYASFLNNFDYYIENGKMVISKYKGSATAVTVPSEMFGYKVAGIGDYCFYSNKTITKVTLPDTLEFIGDLAFCHDYALTTVNFPKSLTSIGHDAFFMCKSLNGVTLPEGLKTIGSGAFFNCLLKDKAITVPYTVTSIGVYAIGYIQGSQGFTYNNDCDYSKVSLTRASNFTVSCYENRAGHTYAKNNNLSFKLLNHTHVMVSTIVPPTTEAQGYTLHSCKYCNYNYKDNYTPKLGLVGDADKNGVVDNTDLELIKAYLSGATVTIDLTSCDYDGDKKVTLRDYALLRNDLSNDR